nr:hypothetical protein [Tanacetum cinerariifolium]
MSTLDKSSSSISDLYKGLNVITELLKDINNAVKDNPATNKKINEAIKTFSKISAQTNKILSLLETFTFSNIRSTMQDLHSYALEQEEASTDWTKSSTNIAWNLGLRMTVIGISQTALKLKRIATELEKDPSKKLVPASTIICPDPDEPIRVKFMINGKIVYLTEQEIQEY